MGLAIIMRGSLTKVLNHETINSFQQSMKSIKNRKHGWFHKNTFNRQTMSSESWYLIKPKTPDNCKVCFVTNRPFVAQLVLDKS